MADKLPQEFIDRFEKLLNNEEWAIAEEELKIQIALHGSNDQLKLLAGRLAYIKGEVETAEGIFREVMKSANQPHILAQARKGLLLIEQDEINRRKERSEAIATSEDGQGMGFLALLPVDPQNVQLHSKLVTRFARILRTDPHSARFHLPMRDLKIIKVGAIANLQAYGEELQQAEIPCVWISLNSISSIQVEQVRYFQLLGLGEVQAVCAEQEIVFQWEQVEARVDGVLPTYGNVVDIGARNKIIRREQVLDHVRICDFHLPSENLILRFHDSAYDFEQGMQIEVERSLPNIAPTIHERWQGMMNWFSKNYPHISVHSHFSQFSDMLMLHPELVKETTPRITISRPKPQQIDNCFELFSGTLFLLNRMNKQ